MKDLGAFKVFKTHFLTDSTYILRIERNGLVFVPGQCVSLGRVGQTATREYSIYSGARDPYLEFLIRKIDSGSVSIALSSLKPNDEVTIDNVHGRFLLDNPSDTTRQRLFIASGTGIAPYHSFIYSYPDINYRILHGVRFLEERYDSYHYDKDRYISCISKEEGGDFHGRVTDYLVKNPVDGQTTCYLCGNNAMISDVYELLRKQGVAGDNIVTEIFF